MLDLTNAVRSGPELIIELRVRGGDVELVLAPGMVVDANDLSARRSTLATSPGRRRRHAGDAARAPGRPDAARSDQHPVAAAAPMKCAARRFD
jgi:hypothetical protein